MSYGVIRAALTLKTTIFLLCGLSYPAVAEKEGFLEKFVFDYTLIKGEYDVVAHQFIELGLSASFSSYSVQLAAYDKPAKDRSKLARGEKLFSALRVPDDVTLEFGNSCYIVRYDFDVDDILLLTPNWIGPNGGAICVQLVSKDSTRRFSDLIGPRSVNGLP